VTVAWTKAVRDVWRSRTRATLVVLAIAIGLSGFLAVLSTYAVLGREINRGYLATNPASAVLRTDVIDDALLAAIAARADVADVDARRTVTARLRTPDGSSRRVVFFVIRDFANLRISTVMHETGEWPPAIGGMLIERDAFQVARARVGDTLTVVMPSGREQPLRVVGGVHDAGQAQARMENSVYAYITPATLGVLGESTTLDRLYLLVGGDQSDVAHVRRVAADVKASMEAQGHLVRRVDVPSPGQHPHAVIMGFLLLVMAAFGVFALTLSGAIVVNLLFATMVNERRQIGVMKAIGGTRRQVALIYLAHAALLGIAAIVAAVPAGVMGGRALSRYFGVLLNFDLASLAVPAWVFMLVVIVGLLVPLMAAMYPVRVGTGMTVRDTLALAGDLTTFGFGRIDRMLCAVGGVWRPLLLGVRNSVRRRTRTALTMITLTISGAFFISAMSFRRSMIATFDRLFAAGTYGADSRYAFDQHMLMIYIFLIIVAGMLAAVGALGLATATSLNVLERRRELGVLRAIGGTPRTIGAIVVIEAVFVVLVAWAIGVVAAWGITAGLGALMSNLLSLLRARGGLDVSLAPAAVAGWLGISIVLAVVASLVPAMSASRRSIREAISYD
jgi:putative ABC transport system permease protein